MQRNDRLLFFFSGHGERLPTERGEVGALITHGVRIHSGQLYPRVEDCVTAADLLIFFRHFMRILTNPEDQRPMLSLYDLYGEIRQGMDAEVQASHQARRPIYAPNPVFGYWPGTDGGEFMIRYRR